MEKGARRAKAVLYFLIFAAALYELSFNSARCLAQETGTSVFHQSPNDFQFSIQYFAISNAPPDSTFGARNKFFLNASVTPIHYVMEMFYSSANPNHPVRPRIEPNLVPPDVAEFIKLYPERLAQLFKETLDRFSHRMFFKDGAPTRVEVSPGVTFWKEFTSHPDPMMRLVAQVYIQHPIRKALGDYSLRVVSLFTEPEQHKTNIINTERLSSEELVALKKLATERGFSLAQFGEYIVAGRGPSFHVTCDIFRDAQHLRRVDRIRAFSRAAKILSQTHTQITLANHEGARGFFSNDTNSIGIISPAERNLETLVHEGDHAMFFQRFVPALEHWARRNGYAMPFQIYGSNKAMLNLIAEIPAWTVGSTFHETKPMTPVDVLKVIRDKYQAQGGEESAEYFPKIWTAERLESSNVYELMQREIRELNGLNLEGLIALGERAFAESNLIDQINFLRLVDTRYQSDWKTTPPEIRVILEKLGHSNVRADIGIQAAQIAHLIADGPPSPQQELAFRNFTARAQLFASGFLEGGYPTFPEYFRTNFLGFYIALTYNMTDYTETRQHMLSLFGEFHMKSIGDFERGFQEMMKQPGANVEEKFVNATKAFCNRPFPEVWSGFAKDGNPSDAALLGTFRPEAFPENSVVELIHMASDMEPKNLERAAQAFRLLEGLLVRDGLSPIVMESEIPTVQKTQAEHGSDQRFVNRARGSAPRWTTAQIDRAFTEVLFGSKSEGKMPIYDPLVRIVSHYFYPEELPILTKKLQTVVKRFKSSTTRELMVALRLMHNREFVIPLDTQKGLVIGGMHAHTSWGEFLANHLIDHADSLSLGLKLELVKYIRLGLSHNFPGAKWGDDGTLHLDEKARAQALKDLESMDPKYKALFEKTRQFLLSLVRNPFDQTLHRAGLYALTQDPLMLVASEGDILRELSSGRLASHRGFMEIVSHTRQGFLPSVDDYVRTSNPRNPVDLELTVLRETPANVPVSRPEFRRDCFSGKAALALEKLGQIRRIPVTFL